MSQFAELERLVSGAIDSHFGERTTIEPKSSGRYFAGQADGTRAAKAAVGIPDFNPVTLVSQDTGKYDGLRPALAGDKIHVSYDADLFVDWLPEQGDIIVLHERNDMRLVVSRTDPDGLGRFVCVCSRAASENNP